MRYVNRWGKEMPVTILNTENNGLSWTFRVAFEDGSESLLMGFAREGYYAVTPHICADTEHDCRLYTQQEMPQ